MKTLMFVFLIGCVNVTYDAKTQTPECIRQSGKAADLCSAFCNFDPPYAARMEIKDGKCKPKICVCEE
jgi:hypothetical protein